MADVIQGTASHVTTPLTATIASLSNNGSGKVRVTTSAPHLFGNGDYVFVNTAVTLGQSQITVVSSTTFDTTFNYTATSTGTATDLSLTPAVLVPTDGDGASAQLSGLLSSQQALLDRTQFLAKQLLGNGQETEVFTASGTWTCPATTNVVFVYGSGGGGGGAGGSAGAGTTNEQAVGGGGGEGAPPSLVPFAVVPGVTYTITVGNGGNGGAAASNGSVGVNSSITGAGDTATFPGGAPGRANDAGTSAFGTTTLLLAALGGVGIGLADVQPFGSGPWTIPASLGAATTVPVFQQSPGGGGNSFACATAVPAWNGHRSITGIVGGIAGSAGASASSYLGGAAGGGGGSGALGQGGPGGNGGAGSPSVAGGAGTNGAAPTANSGAGGGGGGAGGASGSSSGGAGGAGGAGGSGFIVLYWTQGLA